MLLMKLELRTITLIFCVLLMFLMFVKVYISMIKSGLLGFGLIVGVLCFFYGFKLIVALSRFRDEFLGFSFECS